MRREVFSLVVFMLVFLNETHSQNARISWWGINNGFSQATASNAVLRSAGGQAASALGVTANHQVRSGFLGYQMLSGKGRVSVIVLLEGPFNSSTFSMNTSLRTDGHLAAHFSGVPVPALAVDSIALEIRDNISAASSTLRQFRPAWLLANGSIRDFIDTTKSYVEFDAMPGNYYLVVWHRNHIPVMTSTASAISDAVPAPYNFTAGQGQAFGTDPMKVLPRGLFGMIAGDANNSGIVTAADANSVFGSLNATGYIATDVNLSGIITAADANTIFGNLSRSSQVPLSPSKRQTEEGN